MEKDERVKLESLRLEKHDLLILTSAKKSRTELQTILSRTKRANKNWNGRLVHLLPSETIEAMPGRMAFDLCKTLMKQFFPDLYSLVEEAEKRQLDENKQKEEAVQKTDTTPEVTA